MSAVQTLLLVLALVVVGIVGWKLGTGTGSAARDSGRCLDPRQAGCRGGDVANVANVGHAGDVAASKVQSGTWRTGGGGISGKAASGSSGGGSAGAGASGGSVQLSAVSPSAGFEVPTSALSLAALATTGASAESDPHPGQALQSALRDLLREMPQDVTARDASGTGKLTQYLGPDGQPLFAVSTGPGGTMVTDHDRGLVFRVGGDGTMRSEAALLDPGEAPATRTSRLVRRWGLRRDQAAALGKSATATAAFIDMRRAGLGPQGALDLARQATRPMPRFDAWYKQTQAEMGGPLDPGQARSYYSFLEQVPVVGRLLAVVLGESPLEIGQRFGFSGAAARDFLDGASSTDLRLGMTLPRAMLPRVGHSSGGERKSLRALVGDPGQTASLPLCLATLQQALDRPEEVAAALSRLPADYPYVLLTEEDGEGHGRRPVIIGTATLLSWASPVVPGSGQVLERLAVLPADAPVAVRAPLTGADLEGLGLGARAAGLGSGELSLQALALAGPLRERLQDDAALLSRMRAWVTESQARPPAVYFGQAPFLYAVISARSPQGAVPADGAKAGGAQVRILARRGIPSGELLHLQEEQAGLPLLGPRSVAIPADASAALRGALERLFSAHQRAFESVRRHHDPLSATAAGRDTLARFSAIEAQVAMTGLLAACMTQGRCPLDGLRRPEDGALVLEVLQGSLSGLRQRVLLCPMPLSETAQISDRLGELLAAADHLRAVLSERRRFRPLVRDAAALAQVTAYVRAATGELPVPDPEDERALLVRDLRVPRFQERLRAWEQGSGGLGPAELDAEGLAWRRDRGEVPADLGQLVQRYGDALQQAPLASLLQGVSRVRIGGLGRMRQRFSDGLRRVSVVQTVEQDGELRDVEVLIESPGGEVDGTSYAGDGRLVTAAGGPVPLGGSGCWQCHVPGEPDLNSALAPWQPGYVAPTWLTPVAAAGLEQRAAAHRAAGLR